MSGFYKKIDAPIEQAVDLAGSAAFDTFQQNQDGKLYGFEFEGAEESRLHVAQAAGLELPDERLVRRTPR